MPEMPQSLLFFTSQRPTARRMLEEGNQKQKRETSLPTMPRTRSAACWQDSTVGEASTYPLPKPVANGTEVTPANLLSSVQTTDKLRANNLLNQT